MGLVSRNDTSLLNAEIENRYQIVKNYYAAKKRGFINFWNKEIQRGESQQDEKNIMAAITSINDTWTQVYNNVVKSFSISNSVITGAHALSKQTYLVNNPDVLNDATSIYSRIVGKYSDKLATQSNSSVNIYSEMGKEYEAYAVTKLNSYIDKVGNAIIQQTASNLQTGSGSLRQAGTASISDIVLSHAGVSDTALSEGLHVKYEIDSDGHEIIPTNLIDNDIYGFALKNWQGSFSQADKSFTQSATIRNEINNTFNNSWGDTPKSWNKEYAQATANLHVASRLINIIGAANVLIMLGSSAMWMDEYVASKFFYINLYYRNAHTNDEIIEIDASKAGIIHIRDLNPGMAALSTLLPGLILPHKTTQTRIVANPAS